MQVKKWNDFWIFHHLKSWIFFRLLLWYSVYIWNVKSKLERAHSFRIQSCETGEGDNSKKLYHLTFLLFWQMLKWQMWKWLDLANFLTSKLIYRIVTGRKAFHLEKFSTSNIKQNSHIFCHINFCHIAK